MVGRIRSSGLTKEEVKRLLAEAKKWIYDRAAEERYNQLLEESKRKGLT